MRMPPKNLVVVDERELPLLAVRVHEGVTGSVPGARTDIDDIIQRKIDHDDFDMLLMSAD